MNADLRVAVNRAKDRWNGLRDYLRYEYGFLRGCMGHSRLGAVWCLVQEGWMYTMENTLCRLKGHKVLTVDSHAGPDSGWESFQCKRCGVCWGVTYY